MAGLQSVELDYSAQGNTLNEFQAILTDGVSGIMSNSPDIRKRSYYGMSRVYESLSEWESDSATLDTQNLFATRTYFELLPPQEVVGLSERLIETIQTDLDLIQQGEESPGFDNAVERLSDMFVQISVNHRVSENSWLVDIISLYDQIVTETDPNTDLYNRPLVRLTAAVKDFLGSVEVLFEQTGDLDEDLLFLSEDVFECLIKLNNERIKDYTNVDGKTPDLLYREILVRSYNNCFPELRETFLGSFVGDEYLQAEMTDEQIGEFIIELEGMMPEFDGIAGDLETVISVFDGTGVTDLIDKCREFFGPKLNGRSIQNLVYLLEGMNTRRLDIDLERRNGRNLFAFAKGFKAIYKKVIIYYFFIERKLIVS